MRHALPASALALLLAAPAGVALAREAPLPPRTTLTMEQIMADPEWIGPPVESAFWALDGGYVVYSLERKDSDLRDQYLLDLASGESRQVSDAELATLDAGSPVYDRERQRALFVRNGDVFLRELASGRLQQLTRSEAVESEPMFLADGSVAWLVDNQWVLRRGDGVVGPAALLKFEKDPDAEPEEDSLRDDQLRLISTLAREKAAREAARTRSEAQRAADGTRVPRAFHLGEKRELAGSSLSPSGRWMLLVTQEKDAEEGKGGKMPKYVTESGYEEVEDVRTRVGRNAPVPQQLVLLDLQSHTSEVLDHAALAGITEDPLASMRAAQSLPALEGQRPLRINQIAWNRAGTQVAVQLRAIDNKDRWIATVDLDDATLVPQHRLTDEAWINWGFNDMGWLHDGRTLWWLSEQDGYSHIYLGGDGRARQLTDGEWEVSSPQLSADGSRFLFLCNRAWPGDYEVCEQPVRGGDTRELTALDGAEAFAQSPSGDRLLVSYSGSYLPMQLALVPAAGGEARRLTDTRSEPFRSIEWMEPHMVEVPSSHVEAPIWSKLYLPRMEEGQRYPVVMFVHGAGYTQNTHEKYPYYFREQMFHNLLAQQGYIVLDMDYRASEGYGRDWRTAIYRQMGHPELEDLVDGVQWLVANHQADPQRVGVYGGSYGGFMAFMALFRAPEVFQAGAALRPVTDWSMYNHEYTANILNTPELDPEAYRRSSPIEYAQNLEGDLLIAHGMLDDNVFYQDSVRLAQRLIELKKEDWELAGYPLERHAYQHAESWLDQYRRIHKLFQRVLEPEATTP